MRIEITNKYKLPITTLKHEVLLTAAQYLAMCNLRADAAAMNNYLVNTYKIQLKPLCEYLLMSASFQASGQDSVVITFGDKKLDKLARLITYGNGNVHGCNILKTALTILK